MAEIYTISGTGFGGPDLIPVPTKTAECADQVKIPFFAGASAMVTSVPVALFGVYKAAKKDGAVGITALVGSVILFWGGRQLLQGAVQRFDSCRKI